MSIFGRSLDIDIILYLGLCNGAGRVTPAKGKTSILPGLEKILELHWDKNIYEVKRRFEGVIGRAHESITLTLRNTLVRSFVLAMWIISITIVLRI